MVGRFDFKVGAVNWTKTGAKTSCDIKENRKQKKSEGSEYFSLVLSSITRLLILIDCDLPS